MPKAPWQRSHGVETVLQQWQRDLYTREALTVLPPLAPIAPSATPLPDTLVSTVAAALKLRGVEKLYAHQQRAYELCRNKKHFVVATPTASGKSLCYNLPVLDQMARDSNARALYLFPTRALARDQEHSLSALFKAAGLGATVATYDGDTPSDARKSIRERASVIITNPDMLHAGILPHHAGWAHFFSSLRYVVIDELHAYSGVFGSHVANVFRRLRRVIQFHGGDPVFVCASATVGNPAEHAQRLTGLPIEAITLSGAPSGPRHLVVYNPPPLNVELGIRPNYLKTAVRVTADLVRMGVHTLLFGQSRASVETMLRYLRDRLLPEGISEDAIVAYRGGYLPETRRRVEASMRSGEVRCVVATSALELGVDVGDLDAVVCAGYPGTLAATWQRFGRAGRRGMPSMAVLVPSSAPVDQYVARTPEYLVATPVEEARVDPDNVEIFLQHLRCGAFELPFSEGEAFGGVGHEVTGEALDLLASEGVVHRSASRWHWIAGQYPAQMVSLRSAGRDGSLVVDATRDVTLAEVDARTVRVQMHVGAVYQHEGSAYRVARVDESAKKVLVEPSPHDWFTESMSRTEIKVEETSREGGLIDDHGNSWGYGEVAVTSALVGWRKIRFHTHENLGYEELEGEAVTMNTSAVWLVLDEEVLEVIAVVSDEDGNPVGRKRVVDGLRGVAYALRTVASLALMCSPQDLDCTLGGRADDNTPPGREGTTHGGASPTAFLFDAVAGGVGLAERAFERRHELASRAYGLILSCPCEDGCPACVAPGMDVGVAGRKRIAMAVLCAFGVTPPA
jgi:DEAD/DEAH box helicase domain-containing protein